MKIFHWKMRVITFTSLGHYQALYLCKVKIKKTFKVAFVTVAEAKKNLVVALYEIFFFQTCFCKFKHLSSITHSEKSDNQQRIRGSAYNEFCEMTPVSIEITTNKPLFGRQMIFLIQKFCATKFQATEKISAVNLSITFDQLITLKSKSSIKYSLGITNLFRFYNVAYIFPYKKK